MTHDTIKDRLLEGNLPGFSDTDTAFDIHEMLSETGIRRPSALKQLEQTLIACEMNTHMDDDLAEISQRIDRSKAGRALDHVDALYELGEDD